jgi:hypothetical protein
MARYHDSSTNVSQPADVELSSGTRGLGKSLLSCCSGMASYLR